MHDSLYSYLTENNLIYPRQSGFRKNHSTDTALIQIIDELLFNLDKNRVNGMVLADYCKAFDMVDHGLLLLKVYGVAGETMKWFQSYLADRHQLPYLGGCVSDMALMKQGVPQGSILGPLFFTVFINDLPLHVSSSEIDLYADDTTITSSADCGSMGKLQESLNTSVSEVFNWALANRLPLNEKKTKVLTVKRKRLSTKINNNPEITCNGSLLTKVTNVKLLGLEIDEELSFSEHITTVCKTVSQRIGLLKKIMNYLPLKQRLLYYNALIRPVINYASVLRTKCPPECRPPPPLAPSVPLFNRLKWLPFYKDT